jgi:hypothetical protein
VGLVDPATPGDERRPLGGLGFGGGFEEFVAEIDEFKRSGSEPIDDERLIAEKTCGERQVVLDHQQVGEAIVSGLGK